MLENDGVGNTKKGRERVQMKIYFFEDLSVIKLPFYQYPLSLPNTTILVKSIWLSVFKLYICEDDMRKQMSN